jgi:hypothetical protein
MRLIVLFLWFGALVADLVAAEDSAFGSREQKGNALIGILYDLKQDPKGKPTDMNERNYFALADEFLASGWDEEVLNRYYRATRALYATQIFLPMMSAGEAPRAFGVEKLVKPRLWMVHYKGQVSPPKGGRFRFAGYADDFIAVAINGRTVLVGGRVSPASFKKTNWKMSEGEGLAIGNGRLRYSDWFEVQADEVIDLDIVVGERPGGEFGAFLYWQEEGVEYKRGGGGALILPPFQLAEAPMPNVPYAKGHPLWKALP